MVQCLLLGEFKRLTNHMTRFASATMKSTLFFSFIGLLISVCSSGCSPVGSFSAAPNLESIASSEANIEGSENQRESLQKTIANTLQYNLDARLLSAERNAAWQVLHGVIAYGRQLPLEVNGEKSLAVDYLLNGGELRGWYLSNGTSLPDNRIGIRAHVEANGYISQGHVDQWLAILAQANVKLSDRIVVSSISEATKREHTIADWVDQSLLDTPNNPLDEFSWTVIAALHYQPNRPTWTATDGTTVKISDLIAYEAEQDILTSACGGTHRLMSLAMAVAYANRRGLSDEPAYQSAAQTVGDAMEKLRRFQNLDGSFSANYFERSGASADLSLMISATGHQLEVAAFALPNEQLNEEWMQKAVKRFCDMLDAAKEQPLECGGLYHGLNGLKIYHNRCYGEWQPK